MNESRQAGQVLLIDDGSLLESTRPVLEANGWLVLDATADGAFELAKHQAPDAIVLNVDLGIDTVEALLRRLKLEPMTCAIPVLATGAASLRTGRLSSWAVFEWLSCPIEPYALVAKLQRLLDNRRHAGRYVLIVDDEPDLVEIMTLGLAQQGFRTASAANGFEALESARCAQPDAILLDLDMPRINGWEVLEQLKNHPTLSVVPIVILTGTAKSQSDRYTGLSNGANAYLTKPCSIEEIAQTLLSVMKCG